jgi:hypothetical protein
MMVWFGVFGFFGFVLALVFGVLWLLWRRRLDTTFLFLGRSCSVAWGVAFRFGFCFPSSGLRFTGTAEHKVGMER